MLQCHITLQFQDSTITALYIYNSWRIVTLALVCDVISYFTTIK